jgi:hypothetical protein
MKPEIDEESESQHVDDDGGGDAYADADEYSSGD